VKTMLMVFLISFVVVLSPSYAVIIPRHLVTSDTETTTLKDNGNNMINNQSQQQQFTQCIDNIMNKIQKGEINLDDPGVLLSQCFDQYFRGEKDRDNNNNNNNDRNSTLSSNLDLHSVCYPVVYWRNIFPMIIK
jgi:hypothetical protein